MSQTPLTSHILIVWTLYVILIVLVENWFVEKSNKKIDPDSAGCRVYAASVAQGPLDLALRDVELVCGVIDVSHVTDFFFSQVT